jgi:hypothetical protein
VRTPSGREAEVDGTRAVRATSEAGFYTFLRADSVVWVAAVNPPPSESDLAALDPSTLEDAVGDGLRVTRARDWSGAIFRVRQGPELWWPLLLLAVLLLLTESWVAASGRGARARARETARGHAAH